MDQSASKDIDRGWMTAEEAAEYLGVSAATVKKWVKLRRIPFGRAGSLARFSRADLDAWVRSRGEKVPA